jgi:6-phosphogluconolactonase (cycloisomerase 2 family)
MIRHARFVCTFVAVLSSMSLVGCDSDRADPPAARPAAGAVYVPTNEANNRVVAYRRFDDGTVALIAVYPTEGQGTGGRIVPALDRVVVDPLFSQDSAVLSPDRRLLFVVNAGDGTVTSFRVNGDQSLSFADREGTGNLFPNTLAANGNGVLYVANVNRPDNPVNPGGTEPARICGFRYTAAGQLEFVDASTRELSMLASLPTQVLWNRAGDRLLVVELFARTVSVYPLRADGTLDAPRRTTTMVDAFGMTPLRDDVLLTADVSPVGVAGGGSASSFALMGDDLLLPITEGVPNGRTSPCWTAVTPDGRFLYTSNTEDGDVSSYAIDGNGALTLVQGAAARKDQLGALSANGVPTSGPVDSFVTPDGRFLYVQYSGRGSFVAYRIAPDGQLTEVGEFGMDRLPLIGAEGIVGW